MALIVLKILLRLHCSHGVFFNIGDGLTFLKLEFGLMDGEMGEFEFETGSDGGFVFVGNEVGEGVFEGS